LIIGADYDLCEDCEKLDGHYKTHVFLKIKIPIPALAIPPGALLPVLYPGGAFGDTPLKEVEELQSKTHCKAQRPNFFPSSNFPQLIKLSWKPCSNNSNRSPQQRKESIRKHLSVVWGRLA